MAETLAQQKFACLACGGEAVWNPGRRALVCASCGTEMGDPALNEGLGAASRVRDHPLDAALRAAPQNSATAAEQHAVKCRHCDAISYFDRGTAASRCPFCGSAEIVPYAALGDREAPESIVPLQIDYDRARDIALEWFRHRWLAPGGLRRLQRTESVEGQYVPYWIFGADAAASWDGGGAAGGTVERRFDGTLIPAGGNVSAALAEKLEPYPFDQRVAYQAKFVAGWTVVRAQLALAAAVPMAHARVQKALLDVAKDKVSSNRDKVRITAARYSNETYAQILLPLWLISYSYLGRPYQLAINGVTGTAAGDSPVSIVKLAFSLLVVGWIYLFFNDAEVALKLPFWIGKGLWWVVTRPFAG